MKPKIPYPLRNAWLVSGVVLLVLGTGPLIVGGLLHDAGLVDLGNGLGFGLLFTLTFVPSVVLIAVGMLVAISRAINAA